MQPFQSMQNKDELRKYCKNLRLSLKNEGKLEQISNKIVEKIVNSSDFKNSRHILIYYPKKSEINLLPLLKIKNSIKKTFYFPKCDNDNLQICPFVSENDMQKGCFGVFEPKTEPIKNFEILDLIFVPALCADENCNRLGYGKGFYDRFLKNSNLRAKKIAVVAKCLYFKEIPTEKTDVSCDEVIFD